MSIEHYAPANVYTVLIHAEWILRANLEMYTGAPMSSDMQLYQIGFYLQLLAQVPYKIEWYNMQTSLDVDMTNYHSLMSRARITAGIRLLGSVIV